MAKRARKFFDHVSVITTDPSWHLGHIQKTADGLTIHRIRSFAPSENYHFPSPIELFAQLKESRPQVLHIQALHDLPGPVAGFMDSSRKIELIPNGVDREFQEKYPWREPAEPRILYAGRLERYKNVDKILRAVAQLQ